MSVPCTVLPAAPRRLRGGRSLTAFVTAALLAWGLTAPPAAADTTSAVTAGISAQTPRSVDASPAAADPQGRDEQVIVVEGVDAAATPAPTAAEHELAASPVRSLPSTSWPPASRGMSTDRIRCWRRP